MVEIGNWNFSLYIQAPISLLWYIRKACLKCSVVSPMLTERLGCFPLFDDYLPALEYLILAIIYRLLSDSNLTVHHLTPITFLQTLAVGNLDHQEEVESLVVAENLAL